MKRLWKDERGFGDLELFAVIFIIAMCAALGYGIVMGIWELCCKAPPSPEQHWVAQQVLRCDAMRSRLTYDSKTKTAECYRTPMFRRPKLEFKAKYQGE